MFLAGLRIHIVLQLSWNIVYIPKIIDPLTGHEAKGILSMNLPKLFKNSATASSAS